MDEIKMAATPWLKAGLPPSETDFATLAGGDRQDNHGWCNLQPKQ
jgi:hypothetical protein